MLFDYTHIWRVVVNEMLCFSEPYPINISINPAQKPEIKSNDVDQSQKAKSKLNHSHSMPYQPPNSRYVRPTMKLSLQNIEP